MTVAPGLSGVGDFDADGEDEFRVVREIENPDGTLTQEVALYDAESCALKSTHTHSMPPLF